MKRLVWVSNNRQLFITLSASTGFAGSFLFKRKITFPGCYYPVAGRLVVDGWDC